MLTESYKKVVRSENGRKVFLRDVYFGGGETKSCVFKIQPIANNLILASPIFSLVDSS